MEKKIEEIFEKYAHVTELGYEINSKDKNSFINAIQSLSPTPSLPTDGEIDDFIFKNSTRYGTRTLAMRAVAKFIRTNFSSEKDGSEDLALKFAEWTMDSCVRYSTGLWQHGKDFGNRYTTSELLQIFKNRNTNPPKQEQQTTK